MYQRYNSPTKTVSPEDTIQEVQNVANTLFSTMKNNGARYNTAQGKTKFIHHSGRREGVGVCMGDVTMNQARSCKYLGVMVDEGNNPETDLGANI